MKFIGKENSENVLNKSFIGSYLTLNSANELSIIETKHSTDITFGKFIKVCKELINIAQETAPTINPYLILTQYGRSVRYNDTQWNILCGNVPQTFKKIADENYSYFPILDNLLLPNGERLELPHFWAALNGLFKNHDMCGWAGDLVTFAKDVKDGKTVIFPSETFGMSDWIADSDAYNIYVNYSNNIIDGIEKYYNWKLNEKDRISKFITTDKTIMERFTSCGDYNLYLKALMISEGVSLENVDSASKIMEEYFHKILTK